MDAGKKPFPYTFMYPYRTARTAVDKQALRNARPGLVAISGTATTYAQCGELQAQGNKACEVLPVYSPNPEDPVRYQCLNANVAIGDKCYSTVSFDGSTPYTWNFVFKPSTPPTPPPPRARIAVQRNGQKVAAVNGDARTYAQCGELQMAGNRACDVFPQYSPVEGDPVRYKCINANVAIGDKCFSTVSYDGSKTYTYTFTYPSSTPSSSTPPPPPSPAAPSAEEGEEAEEGPNDRHHPPLLGSDGEPSPDAPAAPAPASPETPPADHYSNSKVAESKGDALSYADCGRMREAGNRACEAVPVWRERGGPVRYMCYDRNVEVADMCVRAMDMGSRRFYYNFWFRYWV
ncbi:hypothetical protein HDU67_006675 [Dinochytrium kinnereticum]|nr:hypothetical protein HDU67_006675 [Dinochytrium kinnereticum]